MDTPGRGLVPHSEVDTGVMLASAEVVAPFDWSNIQPKNNLFPGTNQGSSGTCQTQAYKMAVKRETQYDINVEDIYSHIFLPGGGGYLIAPPQYTNVNGFVLTVKYPDPNPQTEANMEKTITVLDSDRMKVIICNAKIQSVDTIDAVASAIMQNDAAIVGIWYTDSGFSKAWMRPTYSKGDPTQEGHALCTSMPIITSDGLHAIDCQTSWYESGGPDGPCTHHVLDQNFFANGGVFELLTLNFTTHNMQLIKDGGTVYLVSTDKSFKIGVGDPTAEAIFGDEPVTEGSTAGIPQTGTLASGVIFHK